MKKFTILMIAMLVAAMGFAQFQKMETSPFKKQVIYKHTRAANGIALTSVTPADGATVEAGNITISGVVTNNGDENLTSYKISYKVDEEDAVEYAVSEIEVASGETHNFTHPSPAVLAAGTHSIVVTVSEPNGDTDFEAVSQTVNVTATEPVQDVVEIALTSVTPEDNATVTAGNVTISGVVTNNGNVALTSYKVSYKINEAEPVVSTVTIDEAVAAAGTHTFSLTVALEASETPYEIIVTVSEPNGVADGDDTDNSKTINLTVNEPVQPAVAITLAVNPTEVNVNVDEAITITGTVTNTGTDALTSYKFSYTVDGGEAVDSTVTLTEAVATEGTHEFTFTVAAFDEAGTHSIVVTVSNPNNDTEFEALTQTVNVTVSEPVVQPAVAITLAVNPTAANATVGENITITGTVTNTGTAALTTYKFSYAIDTLTPVDSTVTELNIATEGTHEFTFTVAFAEAGAHSIVVTVSEPNGDTEFEALTQTVNVTVTEPTPATPEIALTSIAPATGTTVHTGQNISISGVVTNNGVALTSYKVSYTVDGGEAVEYEVSEIEVANGATHNFTHATPVVLSTEGAHTIVVTVSNPNGEEDGNAEDNSKTITLNAISCDPITTFPYTEGFENGIPQCWTLIDADGDGNNWMAVADNPSLGEYASELSHNSNNAAISESYRYGTGAFSANNWMITPAITLPTEGEYLATWYAMSVSSSYPDSYSVYVGTEPTIASMTANAAAITHNAEEGDWTMKNINLSAYAGRTIYIGFNHNNTDNYAIVIDDFSIITTPTAPEIALTSVAPASGTTVQTGQSINIGGVVTNNGVDLTSYKVSYTVDGGEAVEYAVSGINVALGGTHNFAHATPIVLETAGEHTIVVTVSNPNGTADDASDNSQTINVNVIDCSAPISDFPYEEGFENGIPACWTLIDVDGDGNNWMIMSENPALGEFAAENAHGGEDVAISESFRNNVGAYDANNWMITSAISIPENGVCEVSWYAASVDGDYPDTYSVYIGTEPTVANLTANAAVVREHTPGTEWEQKNVSLAEYAGQTIYIGFNHVASDNYVIMIDDLSIVHNASVEGNIAETIAVYPNPTSSMVTIANAEGKDIVIVNSLGQVVANIENAAANQTIDVANFANGTYFVKVDGEVVKLNVVK